MIFFKHLVSTTFLYSNDILTLFLPLFVFVQHIFKVENRDFYLYKEPIHYQYQYKKKLTKSYFVDFVPLKLVKNNVIEKHYVF